MIENENKDIEQKEEVIDKVKSFQFDEIIKKEKVVIKKPNEPRPKKEKFEIKKSNKKTNTKKERNQKKKQTFKYGKFTFKKIEDVSAFLFLEYPNREKHATKLLKNKKFLKWLEITFENQELFNEWVKMS